MKTYYVLLSVIFSCWCFAEGAPQVWYQPSKPPSNPEVNFGSAHVNVEPTDMERLAQGSKTEENWRQEVLDLLKQMALQQKEVVQQLGELEKQGSQQVLDLQNLARHQSLLVENYQALLVQISRITGLQPHGTKERTSH